MNHGWKIRSLQDVCHKASSNLMQKNIDPENGFYPVFGASGIAGYIDYYVQAKDYIGIIKDGSGVGRVSIYPKESSLLGTLQYIIPNENMDLRYVAYALKSMNLSKYVSGAAIPHIYFRDYGNAKIAVPSIQTQSKIADELDKLNELIEIKRNQLKDLDALAQSLFYETFGDPIENPKGWEMKQLYEECIDIVDGDHLAPPKSNEGIPFITISNIDKSRNCIDFTDSFFVPQNYFEGLKENKKPRKGDVLYTVTGSYGITVLIKDKTRFCFQRHIGLIRPKETLNSVFLMYWGRTSSIKHHADSVATGIAQKTVSLKALRTFPLFLPPLALQEQFAERIEAIEAQKRRVEASIADLETLLASRMDYWFND